MKAEEFTLLGTITEQWLVINEVDLACVVVGSRVHELLTAL
jgi:hypothetical protein